ncbi:MAG: PadR family transcriptional regulator [Deltaproteobacteria bacterium]
MTVDTKGRPILQGMVRGLLPLYVLQLLAKKHAHGLEIAASIRAMNNGAWAPSPGSLYPALRQLERDGLIDGQWEATERAPRRVYRLSRKGRTDMARIRVDLVGELRVAKLVIDVHLKALTEGDAP